MTCPCSIWHVISECEIFHISWNDEFSLLTCLAFVFLVCLHSVGILVMLAFRTAMVLFFRHLFVRWMPAVLKHFTILTRNVSFRVELLSWGEQVKMRWDVLLECIQHPAVELFFARRFETESLKNWETCKVFDGRRQFRLRYLLLVLLTHIQICIYVSQAIQIKGIIYLAHKLQGMVRRP